MKRDYKAILLVIANRLKIRDSLKGDINDSWLRDKNTLIANYLGCKASNLSVWKKRNSIPYEVILEHCLKEDINPLKVFFGKKV